MSGTAQGLPQRMTAFVDPKTGLVSETWWRFLNSLWSRTGGAQSTASLDDAINYGLMADTPAPEPAEPAVMLAAMMADAPAASEPEPAALLAALMADTPAASEPEDAAWMAATMADTPAEPENDPALVALMVAD